MAVAEVAQLILNLLKISKITKGVRLVVRIKTFSNSLVQLDMIRKDLILEQQQ